MVYFIVIYNIVLGGISLKTKVLTKTQTGLILIGLMLSLLLSALDSTIVSTAMKMIVSDLQGTQYYAWPFTIYKLEHILRDTA
jgi:MFS family permease